MFWLMHINAARVLHQTEAEMAPEDEELAALDADLEASSHVGSDECDECDGSGVYFIDGLPQACICSEPQQ